MPVRPLTDAERERLTGFPREVPEEDIFSFFTLSGVDRALVPERSALAIRLGFALSLCAVRYPGFCPDDLSAVPGTVLWYVGQQIGAPPEAIGDYGRRRQTRSEPSTSTSATGDLRRPTSKAWPSGPSSARTKSYSSH